MRRILLAVLLILAVSCSAPVSGDTPDALAATPAAPTGETSIQPSSSSAAIPYALPWCAVDQCPLPEDVVPVVVGGRVFRTCSPQCAASVKADPVRLALEVDRAAVALQLQDYPLDHCVVSGRPLGEHAISALAGTVLVRLCCNGCRTAFDADPRLHLARIATARSARYGEIPIDVSDWASEEISNWIATQRDHLPHARCAVCGDSPRPRTEPRELLLRGTLVRVCGDECASRAEVQVDAVVAGLQGAAFEAQKRDYPSGTCPVSGQELGTHADSVMLGLVLVRTCSPGCVHKLVAARESVAASLRTARAGLRSRTQRPCCSRSCECCGR